jgi:hypothetical protein
VGGNSEDNSINKNVYFCDKNQIKITESYIRFQVLLLIGERQKSPKKIKQKGVMKQMDFTNMKEEIESQLSNVSMMKETLTVKAKEGKKFLSAVEKLTATFQDSRFNFCCLAECETMKEQLETAILENETEIQKLAESEKKMKRVLKTL